MNETYKDYEIDTTTFPGLITVLIDGDELVFDDVQQAKDFIDTIATVE